MATPKKKPAPQPTDEQAQPQDQAGDGQAQLAPDPAISTDEPAPEKTPQPETSEEVKAFARTVRDHSHTRNKQFEPVRGVTLLYGYNGLIRVRGHQHVHVATLDDLAAMSDQALYDAVQAVGVRKKL